MIYILSEMWEILHENYVHWAWYDNLGDTFPTAIWHKVLTAAALSVLAGVVGRFGVKLKL